MKLTHLRIHNYRGILDAALNLFDYSLLVGPNNAGKSTVVDAIRAFYEKEGFKFKPEEDFPFIPTTDKESWIELIFALSEEEHASLADTYKTPGKSLRVRKYFQTTTKTHDGKPAAGSIFGYKTDNSLSNEPFYGAKNVQSGKVGDIVYIPAVSKVDEHTKLSGPSALRDLPRTSFKTSLRPARHLRSSMPTLIVSPVGSRRKRQGMGGLWRFWKRSLTNCSVLGRRNSS